MPVAGIGQSTRATLFAHSGNTCAFQDFELAWDAPLEAIKWVSGCEAELTNPAWIQVQGQIAHICGEKPGAPRYNAAMTDVERNGYDNLILLCPNHHRRIDYLQPQRFTVEILREMKRRHTERSSHNWTTDAELQRFAELSYANDEGGLPAPSGGPRLEIIREGDRVRLRNTGNGDALKISLDLDDNGHQLMIESIDLMPPALPSGQDLEIGIVTRTFGAPDTGMLTVSWTDATGAPQTRNFVIQ